MKTILGDTLPSASVILKEHDTLPFLTRLPSVINRAVRLNNAATTPPFEATLRAVSQFLKTYGALHRGAGPFATETCKAVERAVSCISRFFGLTNEHTMLFTSNTSSAINLFARLLTWQPTDVVLLSSIEHTSNHLPWLYNCRAKAVYVDSLPDGSLDLADLAQKLKEHRGRVKLVVLTGASNLSGYVPNLTHISRLAHQAGAFLFVDAAQLAPHRPIDMKKQSIDALAFSAHKVYAPFGLGVLALPKSYLSQIPKDPGGGSIDMISDDTILWAPPEVRHQAGTWNATGIIALASSLSTLHKCRWPRIIEHERQLVRYALRRMSKIPGLTLHVAPEKYLREDRIGTIPFNLNGYHHALLSAILEHEYGIETRAGTICNHRLVRRWLAVSDAEQKRIEREIQKGNRLASYGIVRASIGIHNTEKDIDALVDALKKVAQHGPRLSYEPVLEEETYVSVGRR